MVITIKMLKPHIESDVEIRRGKEILYHGEDYEIPETLGDLEIDRIWSEKINGFPHLIIRVF